MIIATVETQSMGLARLATAVRRRGHRLLLLTDDRSRYASELNDSTFSIAGVDVLDVDTTDVDAMVDLLRGVSDLAGVVRMTDRWSVPALHVARRLGLPHQSDEAVELLRDKGRLRRHLHDNGYSRGSSVVFSPHLERVDELAASLPFPCVVKDVAGAASENVWLVRRPEDLPAVLAAAAAGRLRGAALTAEPYLVGPLYSAETVSWAGRTRVIGVTSRALSPEPHFREEIASFPVIFPEARRAELARWISAILSSVGYDEGLTHTEFIDTANGFEIVEINARMGGALIGACVEQALGVSLYDALVDLALGQRPSLMDGDTLASRIRRGATQVAIYAPTVGVFDGIDGLESLAEHPGAPVLYPTRVPGESVPSTIDQRGVLAVLLATGATAEFSLHNALSAAGKLTARMR